MKKGAPSVGRYDRVGKCFNGDVLGPWEQHLLWGLRDHLVEDEWEFTRQKTVRIPRQRKQHVQRSRVERGQMGCVPDESGRTGLGIEEKLGKALSHWSHNSFSASDSFFSYIHNIPLQ